MVKSNSGEAAAPHDVKEVLVNAFSNELRSEKILLNVVLAGRSGVGKTSTINSLLKQDVSKVDKYRPGTTELMTFQHVYQGLNFRISDTPGLCDDLPESGNDKRYLSEIKRKFQSPLCMLYVTELDAARVASDEKRAIKQTTEILGVNVWERSVVAFSGADRVSPAEFRSSLNARCELIRNEIEKYTSSGVASQISFLAISNEVDTLPDGTYWQPQLYTEVLRQLIVYPALLKLKSDYGVP